MCCKVYCSNCGKQVDESHHVCPYCLGPLWGWAGGGTLTVSGLLGMAGGGSYVDVADATNWTISRLESCYSGSKEQIATLREMGVDKKVLDNLEENVSAMKVEIDRGRKEF